MLENLPKTVQEIHDWSWEQLAPFFEELNAVELNADNIDGWLKDYTRLAALVFEWISRARVATTQDTTDEVADAHYKRLLDEVIPHLRMAENQIKLKLLNSGLVPDGMEVPLQVIRADAELFREANLPLFSEEQKLGMEYARITGAQTVEIDGEEKTLIQLAPYYLEQDRDLRERVWRLQMERWLQDREAINELWGKLLDVRQQMATNAGFDDYRAYRWRDMKRFDYTPEDCDTFHRAIEEVVVPAAERIYAKRREQLGVETLRPWDLNVDPLGRDPLKPFEDIEEFIEKTRLVFQHVDPKAERYFSIMADEGLLDLGNRKGKGPGGYCTSFPHSKRPFIFMNAVGVAGDVRTLLHEAGHAFHQFEVQNLPYIFQRGYPIEFAEVASMAMELLASPYLSSGNGEAFFSDDDARRWRIEHLEKIILFWPYMAVVDAFQHWVYTHVDEAKDPANCDAKWAELWGRFMKGVDWSGFEDVVMTGWHRKQHIYRYPFYYVEYGLAQLGAVQVWGNALKDQSAAVADYFRALALGRTASLPELYATAGAKFAFDADTMGTAIELIETTLAELEG